MDDEAPEPDTDSTFDDDTGELGPLSVVSPLFLIFTFVIVIIVKRDCAYLFQTAPPHNQYRVVQVVGLKTQLLTALRGKADE